MVKLLLDSYSYFQKPYQIMSLKIVLLFRMIFLQMRPLILVISLFVFQQLSAQFQPANLTSEQKRKASEWVDQTYQFMSQDEKLGQLFIIALYTNKGEDFITTVKNITNKEKIGGLILMQDDAAREIKIVNELQAKAKIPLMIGMDAEWGLFQRIAAAHKLPWAITLGAIQDKKVVYELAQQIAADSKRMGINWDFAPVVDVNTNPANPIIGNRSFGSDVENVTASALAYSNGLQDSGILGAIKHFPGHGDTDTDSHLDLPVISHNVKRLNEIELAPFKALMNKGIGGVMVAHLYVPALELQKGVPASLSKNIITGILKEKFGYKGLIITDALNMNAVAKRYKAGELDALAFKAGNDIMLFSQDVATGKRLIQQGIEKGEIPQSRLEESVKKILLTKYYLGLHSYTPVDPKNINADLNNENHVKISQKVYSHALTLLKNEGNLLPLNCNEKYYFVPLEEAPHETFLTQLNLNTSVILKKSSEINSIPANSKVIVGFHKDNSTAYKPYKISDSSKKILQELSKKHEVILNVFGSPYALRDVDISNIDAVLVSYENNDDSMTATAAALNGKTKISGRLPVLVNDKLKYGMGMDLKPAKKSDK